MAKLPAQPAPIGDNRAERILAYMVAATILMSIAAFLAIVIGTWAGAGADNGFGQGIWPVIFVLPMVGLPIGLVLILSLLIVNIRRRAREQRR
ncbi:MAG TPA: hypothetical protein VGP24_14965 [Glaciihabitans sp.]|nr:hypothetical protein [Glaciihabitans sp.]